MVAMEEIRTYREERDDRRPRDDERGERGWEAQRERDEEEVPFHIPRD